MDANYFIGVGEVYVELENDKLLPIFECSSVKISQSEKETTLKDHMGIEGGDLESITDLDSVELELTIHSLNKENIGFILRGDAAAFVDGSVVAADYVAKDGLIRLAHSGATNHVVTNSGATVTYVEGVDYSVKNSGIYRLAGSTFAIGAPLKVSYDFPAFNIVEAFTQAQRPMKVCIDGMNKAKSGAPVTIDLHKVKFGLANTLDLIGEDFASATIKGRVLKDPSQPAGTSKYYKVTSASQA